MSDYSDNFERDWSFYVETRDIFTFSGDYLAEYASEYDPMGVTAKEAFHKYDSTGEKVPTREPVLLAEVFRCKASVNLHIKMWAQGVAEYTFPDFYEYMEEIGAPEWVIEAVEKQSKKIAERRLEERGSIL